MFDVADLSANPKAPEFGDYGACRVRFGKAPAGSSPKRRTVLCVHHWLPDVLDQWITEIRPRYEPGVSDAMWPTERTARVSDHHIGRRFAELRVGLTGGDNRPRRARIIDDDTTS
jgi:integrase/recombinase XerC